MIWREKRVLLLILGVLLLANTIFFFTYRVQYVTRLTDSDQKLHDTEEKLQQARRARVSAEQQLATYAKVQRDLQVLYNDRWSTQTQRFTALIGELKRLEVASQLVPRAHTFTHVEGQSGLKESGIGTSTVAISYTVQGTYEQIRRLINLLELSDQFVIIDSISLGSVGGNDNKTLTLNLRLKTLFREPPHFGAGAANRQL